MSKSPRLYFYLFAAGILLYLPFILSPGYEYAEEIQRMRAISEGRFPIFWSPFHPVYEIQFYRPLAMGVEKLAGLIAPFAPRFLHLLCSLLNVANGLLLFRLLRAWGWSESAGVAAYFLFLLAPAALQCTGSVHDQGYVAFALLLFLFLSSRPQAAWWQEAAAIIALEIGAVMSKDSAALLPALLICYGCYFGFRRRTWTALGIFALILIIYFPGRMAAMQQLGAVAPLYQLRFRPEMALFALQHFFFHFVPLTARVDHLFLYSGSGRFYAELGFSLLALCAWIALVKSPKKILAFALLFLLLLGPALLLPTSIVHQAYLASAALAALLGQAINTERSRVARIAALYLLLMIGAHAILLGVRKQEKAAIQARYSESLAAFLQSHPGADSIAVVRREEPRNYDQLQFRVAYDFSYHLSRGAGVFERNNFGLGKMYFFSGRWFDEMPPREPTYFLKMENSGELTEMPGVKLRDLAI